MNSAIHILFHKFCDISQNFSFVPPRKDSFIRWPDYWHADNWHGGQLACGKLAWRTIGIDYFICFLFNYFNVLTNFLFK